MKKTLLFVILLLFLNQSFAQSTLEMEVKGFARPRGYTIDSYLGIGIMKKPEDKIFYHTASVNLYLRNPFSSDPSSHTGINLGVGYGYKFQYKKFYANGSLTAGLYYFNQKYNDDMNHFTGIMVLAETDVGLQFESWRIGAGINLGVGAGNQNELLYTNSGQQRFNNFRIAGMGSPFVKIAFILK